MLLLHHGLYVMWCRQDIGLEVPQIQIIFFDQQLYYLWDSLQKRMPGTSESSFITALEDESVIKGRV